MNQAIEVLLDHLAQGNLLFHACLEGLTFEELHRRGSVHTNSMLWIAGHVTLYRHRLLGIVGEELEFPWTDLFARGSEPAAPDRYPEAADIIRSWDTVAQHIERRLPQVEEEEWSRPSPRPYPVQDQTLRGAVCFLGFHEAYHLGQMAYVRRILGRPRVTG